MKDKTSDINVYVNSPETGYSEFSEPNSYELSDNKGIILVKTKESLEVTDAKPQILEAQARKSVLMFFQKSDIPYFIFATINVCIAAAATPLQTLVYGKIFARLSNFYSGHYSDYQIFISDVRLLCLLIMAIGGCKMLFTFLGVSCWMQFGERQQLRARTKLYKLMLSRKMEWFDSVDGTSGQISQVNRCVEELRSGSSEVIGLLVQSIASIIALLITSLYHSWSLTLVIMATSPIMAIFSWLFGRLTYKAADQENRLNALAAKILDWCLSCASVVRVFNGKYVEQAKFNRLIDMSAGVYFKLAAAMAGNSGILRTLSIMMFVQGFWFGNYMISIGDLDINQVFTCFTSCLMLGAAISDLANLLSSLNTARAAASMISKFMLSQGEVLDEESHYLQPAICKGRIEFKDVCFHYPGREGQVLNNLSATIEAQKLTFIIGKSGSGKSTISQLLLKMYSNNEGTISIDGHDISTLSRNWITDSITVIEQSVTIYNQTLRNNLAVSVVNKYGSLNSVPLSLILDALSFARLNEVVEGLEDGIDTTISSSTLSGGQKQRVAIARAKLRDTPILILDESLCALDNRLRIPLFNEIREWRKGKTTIVIVHELDYLNDNDNVIVLENGSVKYHGLFEEVRDQEIILRFNDEISFESKTSLVIDPIPRKSVEYNYLTNPVILKDLEKNVGSKIADDNSDEVYCVLAILKYCFHTIETKPWIAVGLLFSVFSGIAGPVFSFSFSRLLSSMVEASVGINITHKLKLWSLIVVGISVASGGSHFVSSFILSFCSEKWILKLRKLCFQKINEQDMSFIDLENTKASEITALLMNDSRDLRNLVSEFLSLALNLVVMVLVGVTWSIISGWKLALVGISFVPLVLSVTRVYGILLELSENCYKSTVAKLENHNYETLTAIRSITILRLQNYFKEEFDCNIQRIRKRGTIRALQTGLGLGLTEGCNAIATGTILYYGMVLAGKNEYTQQQLLQVITILTLTMTNAAGLMNQLPEIARGQRAGTRIIKLLNMTPSEAENDGDITINRNFTNPLLQFDNLQFGYSGQENVLKNVSFNIDKDDICAIVGKSGGGKSTIASLLMRLYNAGDRSIFLSNYDIMRLDIDHLRDTITIVPQNPSFFEGTIFDNLTYGINPKKRVNMDKIYKVLKYVNMYSYVLSLPEGVHTIIGEGSHSLLSGGQSQRLSIARALIRDPQVLILDECTSNLDKENTDFIINLINTTLRGKMTIILITHDVEVMKVANRIIKVKNGYIVEQR